MNQKVDPPKQKPIVMLYSGGADSALMLRLAQMSGRQPHCILIKYGQKHLDEISFAIKQLNEQKVSYQIIDIDGLNVDSGLTGDLEEGTYDNVHEMHVPARNTIFIGLAMSIAESKGIDEVWYGPDYSDRINLFPDCYQEYVVKMNEMMEVSGPKPIKLVAPLLGMSKELILEMLDTFWGITPDQLYSGYEPPVGVELQKQHFKEDCDCGC